MNIKYIVIVLGEPFGTFSEIIGKYFKDKISKEHKIIIVGNYDLLYGQLKILNYKLKLNKIGDLNEAKLNFLNVYNINYKFKKFFIKNSASANKYINSCFNVSLKIISKIPGEAVLINGPVSKKTFLRKKFLGITEFLSKKTHSKNEVMLIYNKKLSVSPITTHLPLKEVAKKINKEKIINNVLKINNFYKKIIKKIPKFAVLGLNPHCETIDKFSEEDKIIIPAIKIIRKKRINIKGPFPADTFFLEQNLKEYDVVIGMYHDQVLTPIKTLYNFNAINITMGLPFIRISPDHGPNFDMMGENKSDPSSLFYAMKFIKNL